MASLAVKYRPQEFKDICAQKSIIKILEKQLETRKFTNCYLFAGPSGTGKTTTARAFAKRINGPDYEAIELDAASHNGVNDIRDIVEGAKQRSIDSEYKVYIIDECHALSNAAWQAFLKGIEECPKYTMFMFCTTDPQKIPATIQNRVMKFMLTKIPTEDIYKRLNYIANAENMQHTDEALDYIAKLAEGGMRDAIANLEKCYNYNHNVDIQNVLASLGNFSYESMFRLTNALIDGKYPDVFEIIEDIYNSGKDLKQFVELYLDFTLDLNKYCLFKSMSMTKLPLSYEKDMKYATSIDGATGYYNNLAEKILNIKNNIKNDLNNKTTIEAMLIAIARG